MVTDGRQIRGCRGPEVGDGIKGAQGSLWGGVMTEVVVTWGCVRWFTLTNLFFANECILFQVNYTWIMLILKRGKKKNDL